MKIALIRAASVNDWELQSYESLTSKYDVTVFGAWTNEYPFTLPFKMKKLPCIGSFFGYIPGGISFLNNHFGDPQILVGLKKALTGFDVAHTVERTNYYTWQAIQAKREGRVNKVLVQCWENISHLKAKNVVQKQMKAEVDAFADLFIAGTKGARAVLLKEGVPKNKIKIVPFGIDTNHFILPPVSKKDITALFAARMTASKGIYVFFDAIKHIVHTKGIKDMTFAFMGEGDEKNRLNFLIKKENLSGWVRIHDFIPYKYLREMYWRTEMLVLPSIGSSTWIEQFGLVLTEAMACGTPVIGSMLGSIPELIGKCGLVCQTGNSIELANAILRLHQSARLRKTLALKARERVLNYYSSKVVSQKLDLIYKNL